MSDFVVPGQPITSEQGFLRGHGAYIQSATFDSNQDSSNGASAAAGVLVSSIAGRIERVNKLISVVPLKSRYCI